jgi:hypothetical protein
MNEIVNVFPLNMPNFMNFINLIEINSNINNGEFNAIIDNQIANIFEYAHQHYIDCPNEIIEQINLCYLRNQL